MKFNLFFRPEVFYHFIYQSYSYKLKFFHQRSITKTSTVSHWIFLFAIFISLVATMNVSRAKSFNEFGFNFRDIQPNWLLPKATETQLASRIHSLSVPNVFFDRTDNTILSILLLNHVSVASHLLFVLERILSSISCHIGGPNFTLKVRNDFLCF